MILAIKTPDLEKDLEYFKEDFDFANLNKNHPLYNPKNDKVIGKMKIETGPCIYIDEFVALRSKSYSYSYGAEGKTTEGSTKYIIKQKGVK